MDGQRERYGDTTADEIDTHWMKEDFLLNSIDQDKVIAVVRENKEIFMSGLTGSDFSVDVDGIKRIADMLQSGEKCKSQGIEGCVWTMVIGR